MHYPSVFYNHKCAYIGGAFGYRYENEIIVYKNVHATADGMHHFLTYTNDNNSLSDQRALLNILAYLNGSPNFEFTRNTRVNSKLDDLYKHFDLLDCVKLRRNNYFEKDILPYMTVENSITNILERNECFSISQLNVNGNDIVKFGIAEGKEVGEILSFLLDEVINNKVENKKALLLKHIEKYR